MLFILLWFGFALRRPVISSLNISSKANEHVLTVQEPVARSRRVAEDLQSVRGTNFLRAVKRSVNKEHQ